MVGVIVGVGVDATAAVGVEALEDRSDRRVRLRRAVLCEDGHSSATGGVTDGETTDGASSTSSSSAPAAGHVRLDGDRGKGGSGVGDRLEHAHLEAVLAVSSHDGVGRGRSGGEEEGALVDAGSAGDGGKGRARTHFDTSKHR